jgi:hypothetical protein
MQWRSPATWARVGELRTRAGAAAKPPSGAALADLLRRGSVTLRAEDVPLWVALRRLQIETFAEIALVPTLVPALEAVPVRLDAVSRPLGTLLDDLVAQVPGGLRWEATRSGIVLTRDGDAAEATLRVHYFDVRDLLEPTGVEPRADGSR